MINNFLKIFQKTDEKILAIILFLFVFAVLQVLQKPFWDAHIPGGDEPIYLAITYSITHNKTLDLTEFLQQKQWQNSGYNKVFDTSVKEWKLTPPAPQAKSNTQFSIHNFGFPLVIALPFYFFGRLGAVILTQIIGALIAVCIFYLCRKVKLGKLGSMFVGTAMSLSLPLSIYSYLMFSDILAALLIAYAFIGRNKILTFLSIAYLPFIKIKYIFQTIIYAVIFWIEKKSRILMIIIILLSVCLLSIYCKYAYGSFSPFVIKDATGSFGSTNGLLGLLLDRRMGLLTHAPFYLLIFPGITLLFIHYRKIFWQWCAIILPYYLMVGLYNAWHGDHAPPSRHLVAIIPLLALPLAALLNVRNKPIRYFVWIIFIILVVVSLAVSFYGIVHPGSLYLETKDNIGIVLRHFWPGFNIARWFPLGGDYDIKVWTWVIILVLLLALPFMPKIYNFIWQKRTKKL